MYSSHLFISRQIWIWQQSDVTKQWRHLSHLPLRKRSAQSVAHTVLLLGQPQVRASDVSAAMADGFRDKLVRTVQVSVHHAHKD